MDGTVRVRHLAEEDWPSVTALEARAYAGSGLSEGPDALRSRAAASPETCFVLDRDRQVAGYLLALPYPPSRYPDPERPEERGFRSRNLHLHDVVVAERHRGQGLAGRLLARLTRTAAARGYERISLVAVGRSAAFWSARGFSAHPEVEVCPGYGDHAQYMSQATPTPGVP
ncbi:GNAT family N-acetyltransferase [Streptomyces sp. MS06]|uniref:GNAT family N-acetyltransferase n=1 Tax=Streptomyces sp. MS06 TaxID=3385974 RepID=UPI0039A2C3CF